MRKKKAFGYDKSLDQRVYPGLYDVDNLGFNYRMSEIHASIGTIQIKKIKEFLKIRSFNFKFLESEILKIKNISVVPNLNTFLKGSFYCLSLLLSKKISNKRFHIINELKKAGIGTSIYYPNPIPRLKYYKMKYKIKPTSYKIASKFSDQIICLPIGPHVSPKEIKFMSKSLLKIIAKYD